MQVILGQHDGNELSIVIVRVNSTRDAEPRAIVISFQPARRLDPLSTIGHIEQFTESSIRFMVIVMVLLRVHEPVLEGEALTHVDNGGEQYQQEATNEMD